ncbi:MAG: pitrilysin family protein [Dehalococcoidales bacterium]
MHKKTTLDNGLRVITSTMPHTRSVSICIFIGVGSRYEAEPEAGVSHFIEHLLFRGTHKRKSSREISEAIEGVGGILNGGTDREVTVYWCKVAQHHFPMALDVLTDMLLNSRFKPQDIEKERRVIVEEINMSYDSPSQRVNLLIDEIMWPEHPLGRDVAGSKQSVAAITREAMLDYLKGQYLPGNTVVSVAGNIRHREVVAAVSQAMAGWSGQAPPPAYAAYREKPAERLRIEKRDIEQAHLCLALPGVSFFDPKRFTIDLLNVILGEGMSSRLFCEVRDRLGLAYSINSFVEHFSDTGSLTIYAGVEPKNLKVAIRVILEQLSRLKEETVPESEMLKVKELSKGRLQLRMEDSRSVAGWFGGQEVLTGRILSVDRVLSIVDAITADEIKGLAGELMTAVRPRLAVVGPVAGDEPLEELLKL